MEPVTASAVAGFFVSALNLLQRPGLRGQRGIGPNEGKPSHDTKKPGEGIAGLRAFEPSRAA